MGYRIFKGVEATLKDLKKLQKLSPDIFAIALFREVTAVEFSEVKKQTPIDKGPLRASLMLSETQRAGRRIWVEITANTDYALSVHEDLEASHKEPTRARFIAAPIEENSKTLSGRLAKRIDQVRKEG